MNQVIIFCLKIENLDTVGFDKELFFIQCTALVFMSITMDTIPQRKFKQNMNIVFVKLGITKRLRFKQHNKLNAILKSILQN
ncbi:LOW QUALITY PROTEIN: hypothetical protein V1478_004946 [Vespula squamosa]|uniref:Uncharacterized protein n=1 Tax=Vespula squamosa TaxID=30214 RepID=A0ABD2BF64_VESSQ